MYADFNNFKLTVTTKKRGCWHKQHKIRKSLF